MQSHLLDPGLAGTLWRSAKLIEFEEHIRSLGRDDQVEARELLRAAKGCSESLEQLWRDQQSGCQSTPWWADGEYSDVQADRANDEGMEHFRAKRFKDAYSSYTESVRLCPSKSVYHCNQAAAALKLGLHKSAVESARQAIARDPAYLKAYLRGGVACCKSGKYEEAVELYGVALRLQPDCKPAQTGLQAAERQAAAGRARHVQQAGAAQVGCRPAMPLLSTTDPAELLYTAEELVKANPDLEAAKCMRCEALIFCQRYKDAADAAAGLMPGADRAYLGAQAAWRWGHLQQAQAILDQAGLKDSCKRRELHTQVSNLQAAEAEAREALEDGRLHNCIKGCTEILTTYPAQGCSGMHARMLHTRARALREQGLSAEAVTDLTQALSLEPVSTQCLEMRSQVLAEQGEYVASLLDLQSLQQLAPDMPGLLDALRVAACRCLAAKQSKVSFQNGGNKDGSLYAVLGVDHKSSPSAIGRAYRKLAATWHPDKWVTGSEEEQNEAQQRFSSVTSAYEVLSDQQKRMQYDTKGMVGN